MFINGDHRKAGHSHRLLILDHHNISIQKAPHQKAQLSGMACGRLHGQPEEGSLVGGYKN